jgi:hypothetical protein
MLSGYAWGNNHVENIFRVDSSRSVVRLRPQWKNGAELACIYMEQYIRIRKNIFVIFLPTHLLSRKTF